MINSKSSLAVILSKLKGFENPKVKAEQYTSNPDAAADVLWFAFMNGDIKDKIAADFGCGPGMLGIGCLLLGAKKAYFVDSDEEALAVAGENIAVLEENYRIKIKQKAEFICCDIKNFNKKADVVVQNPPFGVKNVHADKGFLETAFKTSKVVYSFHKIEAENFIRAYSRDSGFSITHLFSFVFHLKKTYEFQQKRVHKVEVGCWRIQANCLREQGK